MAAMTRENAAYRYDGTMDGFYSCVFEGYDKNELPLSITSEDEPLLIIARYIDTDAQKARRVRAGILKKAGADALNLIETAFLNGDGDKALWIERFVRFCLTYGQASVSMRGEETVSRVHRLAQAATRESHLLKGFIRFTDYGTFLGSVIGPKHYALPLLREHFCQRFNAEQFIIYDRTHSQALAYRPCESRIMRVEGFALPDAEQAEEALKDMWRGYYKAVTIEPRVNLKLHRQMLPLRFRPFMTEMQAPSGQNSPAMADEAPKNAPSPDALALPGASPADTARAAGPRTVPARGKGDK